MNNCMYPNNGGYPNVNYNCGNGYSYGFICEIVNFIVILLVLQTIFDYFCGGDPVGC